MLLDSDFVSGLFCTLKPKNVYQKNLGFFLALVKIKGLKIKWICGPF